MNRAQGPASAPSPVDTIAPVRADELADPFLTAQSPPARTIEQAQPRRTFRPGWFDTRVRPAPTALLWFAAAVVLGASIEAGVPRPGGDNSWITAINVAAAEDRRFGSDLVFTYGPWGFLNHPLLVSGGQFALGVLFAVASMAAVFCAAYVCLKRTWSVRVAAPVAFIVSAFPPDYPGRRFVCVGLVFALLTLERRGLTRSAGWRDAWPAPLLAAFAAFMTQIKFSEGMILLVLAGIVAVAVRTLRACAVNAAATGAAFTVTFVLSWLAAGQRLGDLVSWLRYSWEIANGYQEAMAVELPYYMVGYLLAVPMALVAVALAVRMARRYRGPVALGVVLVVAAALEFGFKHGFIRFRGFTFYLVAGFVLIALARYARRPAAVLVTAVLALALLPIGLAQFDPFPARDRWRASAEAVLNDSFRVGMVIGNQQVARDQYRLSASMVAETIGHPVSVDPVEATLPWAYSMDWHPVPVFQSYVAYTASLDALNARAIVAAPSDQIVLRQHSSVAVDGRNIRWETPRYLLALACNYTVGANEGGWSLLRHGENRCARPRSVKAREVNAGQVVETPTVGPNEILVARFTPRPDGLLRSLSRTVFKDWSPLVVTADDVGFRLPKALADGPLMVSLPDTLGWAGPFDDFHYKHLSFNHAGRLEFQVVAVRPLR